MRTLAALLLLVPTIASAEKLHGEHVPSPSAIRELGLQAAPHAPLHAQSMVVFLAFEGPNIAYAELDDSHSNTSHIDRAAVQYAPYGDDTARAALVQAVLLDWSPYAVTITESRPASGDYVMAVVSPTNPYAGEAAGIAPLDCGDTWTRNNVVFAFHGANDGYAINEQARTVGQEVAHSIGLEHTTVDDDIMSYAYGPADFWFVDQCSAILTTPAAPEIYCVDQHAQFCPAGQQNSHAELLELVGAGTPDTQGPVLTITAPQDGTQFTEGDDFTITVDAADEVGVIEVELFSNGVSMANDDSAPYGWPANGIPAGQYELYAEARDAAGNVTQSDVVVIDVAPADASPEPGESTGDPGGAESSSGDEPGDPLDPSGELDDDGLPPGYGQNRGEAEGCTIATGRPSFAMLLAVLALGRRRRRAA